MLKFDINLLFTVINILILYFVVRRFLFKPVQNILAQRQAEIDKQYEDAKAAGEQAEETKRQYTESLKGIDQEKNSILSETEKRANDDYAKIVAGAKAEADKIVSEARKNAAEEKEKRIREAQEEIADLVVEATAKISASASNTNKESDRMLYDRFLNEVGE